MLIVLILCALLAAVASLFNQDAPLTPVGTLLPTRDAGAVAHALQVTGGKVLIVYTLDGLVTALRADTGQKLWSVETGGSLLRASSGEAFPGETSDANALWRPSIIPGRDGSILLHTDHGELKRLPFTAKELADSAPSSQGSMLLMGSKVTRVWEIAIASGAIIRASTTKNGLEYMHSETDLSADDIGPTVWVGRSDFFVSAVSTVTSRQIWNMTYAEIAPYDSFASPDVSVGVMATDSSAHTVRMPGHRFLFQSDAREAAMRYWPKNQRPVELSLASSMHGEVFATDASLGHLVWQSSQLKAPVAEMRSVRIEPDGYLSVKQVKFSEMWPSLALPGPAQLSGALEGDVFVGLLPDGQLYALPRTESTIIAPYVTTHDEFFGTPAITAGKSDDVRLLPAPPVQVPPLTNLPQAADNPLLTCQYPADSSTKLQCLIGMRNISELQADNGSKPLTPHWSRKHEFDNRLVFKISAYIARHVLLGRVDEYEVLGWLEWTASAAAAAVAAVAIALGAQYWSRKSSGKKQKRGARGKGSAPIDVARPERGSSDFLHDSPRNDVISAQKPLKAECTIVDGVDYRIVGRLCVSARALGYGCQGTVVYAGIFDSRPVAIKRMLKTFHPAAVREIALLIRSDNHPNVVRYYAFEEAEEFVYLALELCHSSLAEAMAKAAASRAKLRTRNVKRPAVTDNKSAFASVMQLNDSPSLPEHDSATSTQDAVPVPSPATRAFLRDLVAGITHLHVHRIVHRDIKPHNILLARRPGASIQHAENDASTKLYPMKEFHSIGQVFTPKISDFGLGKQLSDETSSFGGDRSSLVHRVGHADASSASAMVPGTVGWQAPELIAAGIRLRSPHAVLPEIPEASEASNSSAASGTAPGVSQQEEPAEVDGTWRRSRAADVWSLGCVLYHVLDAGQHPFGDPIERDSNILYNRMNLQRIEHIPEAHALISRMLARDPALRPTANVVLEHPFFWDDDKRLAFLQDLSDRLEHEPDNSPLVQLLEQQATAVIGSAGWSKRLPAALLLDMGKYRKYDFHSILDCLRLLRNKRNHYRELPEHVRRDVIGSDAPASLVPYFLSPHRFPHLLSVCYTLVVQYLAHEKQMNSYIGPHTTARFEARSRASLTDLLASGIASTPALEGKLDNLLREDDGCDAEEDVESRTHREWYLNDSDWDSCFRQMSQLTASSLGGKLVPATIDGNDPASASNPDPGNVMVLCAHESLVETKFKGGAHVTHPRYKSTPCKDWDVLKGVCPRGIRCDYAHGGVELRIFPEATSASASCATAEHTLEDLTLTRPLPRSHHPATDKVARKKPT